jgi:hypothetical protein
MSELWSLVSLSTADVNIFSSKAIVVCDVGVRLARKDVIHSATDALFPRGLQDPFKYFSQLSTRLPTPRTREVEMTLPNPEDGRGRGKRTTTSASCGENAELASWRFDSVRRP